MAIDRDQNKIVDGSVLERSAAYDLTTVVNGDGDGCRSPDAFIHVYDGAVNVIETHQHKDEFKAW